MSETYRVNAKDIMHETIDGEVVIVNLDSGAYYAFDGSGEYIWDRLSQSGASREQLVQELAPRFQASEQEIDAGVQSFIAQLLDEQLIEIASGVDEALAAGADAETVAEAAAEFLVPNLNKYTDMEALLLADPIHEVEPSGWPHVK